MKMSEVYRKYGDKLVKAYCDAVRADWERQHEEDYTSEDFKLGTTFYSLDESGEADVSRSCSYYERDFCLIYESDCELKGMDKEQLEDWISDGEGYAEERIEEIARKWEEVERLEELAVISG